MQQNSSEEIVIRNAIPEDATGITEVLYKTWLATYPNKELGITEQDIEKSFEKSFTPESINSLAKKIGSDLPNEKRLVATYGSKVVGVATMVRNEDNNQLRTIYVLPEFQGKGIGKMLWQEAKKFCDPNKDTIVEVATYSQNTIEFYKKLGFVDTGKRLSDMSWGIKENGVSIPEMEMVLSN